MNDFVEQIVELRHADPDRIIGQLKTMFTFIAEMRPTDVVIAYQTIKTTAEVANMVDDTVIRSLLVAIEAQMAYWAVNAGDKGHLARFKVVTGSNPFR